MKTSRIISRRRGFTLIELLTAMAITAMLVLVIGQVTTQGVDLWKAVREDVSTTASSRITLQTMAHDFESFQLRAGDNKYQWLFAKADDNVRGLPKGLQIPRSVRCVFFACAPDRNPSVSSSVSLRGNYREARAHNMETQGDVNAIGYRLMYRDQILNLPGDGGEQGMFPLFSLYRQVVTPRETFENLLGQTNLESAYVQFEREDERNLLCENVVELSLIFTVQYTDEDADIKSGRVSYQTISVPVISSRPNARGKRVDVYGDRIAVDGKTLENARIVSADIAITTLTEEGVAVADQVRLGRRRAPKMVDFFRRYTRSFSRSVSLPQPL